MTLKEVNGKVSFVMKAGKDFVKNEMPAAQAQKLIDNGKITESDKFADYPVCVNDAYYFAATMPNPKEKSEEKPKINTSKGRKENF